MKKHNVNIEKNIEELPIQIERAIDLAANTALSFLSKDKQLEMTVLICEDDYMRELNRTYRGQDKTTDVLSFEDHFQLPGSDIKYMGDIAISYPTAYQQSNQVGNSIVAEISLLTVHGVLHLFGYDHTDDNSKKQMWDLQTNIMGSLGYPDIATIADELNA